MLKWCRINRRREDIVVWEGKPVGKGKPVVNVVVEVVANLPRPEFKPKMVPAKKDNK